MDSRANYISIGPWTKQTREDERIDRERTAAIRMFRSAFIAILLGLVFWWQIIKFVISLF